MDLNILPFERRHNQEMPDMPGLHIATSPRRTARGRGTDRLILYLAIEGNAPLSTEIQKKTLERLAEVYYKTPGSVTNAMRTVADALNQQLLERNQRNAPSGQQSIGLLGLLVLRGERLYLSQSGPIHAFLITAGDIQYIHDPEISQRGLGLGRDTPIYYSQANLDPSDFLLLMANVPAKWSKDFLLGLHGQEPEILRRRLMAQTDSDLQAILIQTKSGPGKTYQLKPKPVATQKPAPITPQFEPVSPTPAIIPEATGLQGPLVDDKERFPQAQPETGFPEPVPLPIAQTDGLRSTDAVTPYSEPEVQEAVPPSQDRESRRANSLRRLIARIGGAFLHTASALTTGVRSLVRRMLPDESIFTIPAPVMALIAVLVPITIVTFATVVYFQRGRAAQYEVYYAQAVQAAGYANQQSDPEARRQAWQDVLKYLELADTYQKTADSQSLRSSAQQVFDDLDLTTRLDFQPAIVGGLPEDVKISRIVATETDLYLLDANKGSVYRAFFISRGYEIDPTYQCGPGFAGSQEIGSLIDINVIPLQGTGEVTIVGIDASGFSLQCQPGKSPVFLAMAPPSTGWGEPRAFTLNLENIYVLDPQVNAVWIYWNGDLTQPPQLFFDEEVPPMDDVIDLAIDKNDLFLLHADGHVTQCAFSELDVSPTRCTDPQPFVDTRPGHEGQVMEPIPLFSQILSTRSPDPSLYILEPGSQSVYHFSLRLTFQRQYRPSSPPRSEDVSAALIPATAFGNTPDKRIVFLAFNNQVTYAGMP